MNLLKETLSILQENGKFPTDVCWVGCADFKTTWDNFVAVADVEYDSGYGAPEVAEDLIVMGDDFWLERHDYDGSEWWEYKCLDFVNPRSDKVIKAVTVGQAKLCGYDVSCGWESLSRINGFEKEA